MAYVHTGALILLCVANYCLAMDYGRPSITYPNRSENFYYKSGDYVRIRCTADGSPPPTWLENDLELRPSSAIRFNQTLGTLEISSFSLRQQTSYRCIATVQYGLTVKPNMEVSVSSMSPKIRLWQLRLEKFASSTDIHKSLTEYDYLVLECGDRKASVTPALKYNWYETGSGATLSTAGGRLFIDLDGSLHFTYVLLSDGLYEGYSCGIAGSLSDGFKLIRLGTKYVVSVLPATPAREPGKIKPKFQYSNTPVYAWKNTTATLECVFSSYNLEKYYWLDVNGQATFVRGKKYDFLEDSRRMVIYNVQESDEKFYYCAASRGTLQASAAVFLNVTSPPVFVGSPPTDQVGVEGTNAQFACDARSVTGEVPPSPPNWFINANRVQPTYEITRKPSIQASKIIDENVVTLSRINRSKFKLSDDKKLLTILNVRKHHDVMCVQCEVENTVGAALASACLTVILPITILTQPKPVQEIAFGRYIDLTVNATTDPAVTLKYRWYFPTRTVDESNIPTYMSFNRQSKLAFINTSHLSFDEYKLFGGKIKINVFNQHESRTVETIVYVISFSPTLGPPVGPEETSSETPPPPPPKPPAKDDSQVMLWLLLLVLLILVAAVVIAIVLCMIWRQKKKPVEEGQPEGEKFAAPASDVAETVSDEPKRFFTTTTTEEVVIEHESDSDDIGSQV